MAQNGGVLVRAGHTEAGCDLPEMAGLTPAAVICEIMNPDGSMAAHAGPDGVREGARPQDRHQSPTSSAIAARPRSWSSASPTGR
jgi:hypothetical protein